MKGRVVAISTLMFLVSIVALSQTAGELRKKYGPPDEVGRYIIRPGIGLTVRADEAGVTRDLMVRPITTAATNANDKSSEKPSVMGPDVAQAILSELAPDSKRGRHKGTGNAEFGCTSVDYLEYDNALISVSNRCSQQGGGTYSINIHWK
jgi:hypothetical protein